MLGHLAPAEHRTDRLADGGAAGQRVARAADPLLEARQLGFSLVYLQASTTPAVNVPRPRQRSSC
jgi:hypothetical protein